MPTDNENVENPNQTAVETAPEQPKKTGRRFGEKKEKQAKKPRVSLKARLVSLKKSLKDVIQRVKARLPKKSIIQNFSWKRAMNGIQLILWGAMLFILLAVVLGAIGSEYLYAFFGLLSVNYFLMMFERSSFEPSILGMLMAIGLAFYMDDFQIEGYHSGDIGLGFLGLLCVVGMVFQLGQIGHE